MKKIKTILATVAALAITVIPVFAQETEGKIENETTQTDHSQSLPEFNSGVNYPLALKTNLLFDAVTALNLEVEVPIGKRWSIAGEGIFPWWLWEKKQHCLQMLSGNLEGRYWFGDRDSRPQLTGWFAGLYSGGGYYDVEWNRKGYQGEFFIASGLSGGYAHTVTKNQKWRMEYSLGVGYLVTQYREYNSTLEADGAWHLNRKQSGRYTWVGPTRAKVSLVWTMGRGR